jgi:cytochrome c556
MKNSVIAVSVIFVVGLSAQSSWGHDHATGVVKERMDAMTDMGKRLKAIRDRIKANRDLRGIKADADAITASAENITHLFPSGSTTPPTRARAAIWQTGNDFAKKADDLKAASAGLSLANTAEAAILRQRFLAVEQACIACHDKYRTGKR